MPVLAVVYATTALARSSLVRGGVAIGLGTIIGMAAMSLVRPSVTTATPPTEIVPLTQAAFKTSVATGVDVDSPATITFSTAMDRASVKASLVVEPETAIELRWTPDDAAVTIVPVGHWAAGTYHTITVQPGALARSGRPLTVPARSAFLTRDPALAVVAATDTVGKRVAVGTSFTIVFDRAVDAASVELAVRLEPPVAVALTAGATVDGSTSFTFTPAEALAPDTRYRLIVDGVRDDDGVAVAPVSMAIRTSVAPAVVRFRPTTRAQDIARAADISVRFTRSMDRASTKRAFRVELDGKPIKGTVRFAEGDTVLVFDPAAILPYGSRVVVSVAASARSAEGAALAKAESVAFRTVLKPAPPKPQAPPKPPAQGGGGGSAGSGSWTAVERYYLGLMNCTRTGGIVTSSGACSSPGGRNVAALKLDGGISSAVARPYAKKLAVGADCSHFIGGNPGDRLRRAGYTSYRWAENLGCRSGDPFSAVLGSHRFFQSERSWSPLGGHYVNLMNSAYDRVGIGVWVSGGRVRLVVDFYHP